MHTGTLIGDLVSTAAKVEASSPHAAHRTLSEQAAAEAKDLSRAPLTIDEVLDESRIRASWYELQTALASRGSR